MRRLRPAAQALAIQWLVLARGGYVPSMQVVNLMPWSALLIAGVLAAVAGDRGLVGAGWLRLRRSTGPARALRAGLTGLLVLTLAGAAAGQWTPQLRYMTASHEQPPLR